MRAGSGHGSRRCLVVAEAFTGQAMPISTGIGNWSSRHGPTGKIPGRPEGEEFLQNLVDFPAAADFQLFCDVWSCSRPLAC